MSEEKKNNTEESAETSITKNTEQLLAEQKEMYLRIVAEAENRATRAKMDAAFSINSIIEKLIKDLIPLLQDLSQAALIANAEAKTGVDLISKNMKAILKKYGIEEIKIETGCDFDANLHQAISTQKSEQGEGKILQVIQPGYTFHGKPICPAIVVISE